jgi:hypothetical protein
VRPCTMCETTPLICHDTRSRSTKDQCIIDPCSRCNNNAQSHSTLPTHCRADHTLFARSPNPMVVCPPNEEQSATFFISTHHKCSSASAPRALEMSPLAPSMPTVASVTSVTYRNTFWAREGGQGRGEGCKRFVSSTPFAHQPVPASHARTRPAQVCLRAAGGTNL